MDYPRLAPALALARRLANRVGLFKVGSELFTAEGPKAVEKLARLGAGIFLDLKFHDIPNTVNRAVAAAVALPGVRLINVHALGGFEMMQAAREAAGKGPRRPWVIAVTILTSLDAVALRRAGISGSPRDRAIRLALLAQEAGLDGVVTSPQEVEGVRRACGNDFLIVTPGIRPASSAQGDQVRTASPAEAIRRGADYLVVGRPITAAPDPVAAADAILGEVSAALRR